MTRYNSNPMTLKQFETWFQMKVRTNWYMMEPRLINEVVTNNIKSVEPQEDRDFLLLKYSEYLI